MQYAQAVDEDKPFQKLVYHVEGTEGSKLEIFLSFPKIHNFGCVLKEALEALVLRPVGLEEVQQLLEGEVTELHLDTEAGDGGAVPCVARTETCGTSGRSGGLPRVTVTVILLPLPLLLDQEAVEILDNVLVLANLGKVFHLLQHLVQVLSWLDLDLLDCKDPVIELVLNLVDLPKVA